MVRYHDREWGVPVRDDRRLFEVLTLEGAQAGVQRLLGDPGIVRNRAKIRATIANARAFLAVQREHGSFAAYVWRFVGGRPVRRARRSPRAVPAETGVARALSRDLVRRGFRFAGPTICYAFMQAAGLVDDHLVGCFRHRAGRSRA